MKSTEAVKIFLLGMITAFLAVLILRDATPSQALAAPGAAAGGVLAVATGTDEPSLFLVDTNTQRAAFYSYDNGRFMLRGARYYKYDMYLREATDRRGIGVDQAQKDAEREIKRASE